MPSSNESGYDPIYIVVGNHNSTAGIQEIVHSLHGCLAKTFTVKVTQRIKNNRVNIIIDEFCIKSRILAMKRAREFVPNTKFVIVATEFVTPLRISSVELMRTFNLFGGFQDWRTLLTGFGRTLRGGMPSYIQLRYGGFVHALECCDLLVGVYKRSDLIRYP